MKKNIWLLFLVCLFTTKVYATETYYSEYGEFSPYQEELVEKSDTVNVIDETRYLWYKEEEIYGDYKLYNNTDTFSSDCYETKYSEWSKDEPDYSVSRTYQEQKKFEYVFAQDVRYIHLFDLQGSYGSFRIPELIIKINGVEIDYTFNCEGCWEDFDKYIHNGIIVENESYIYNDGSLVIDLGRDYPINDIEITFYIFDLGDEEKIYTIGYSKNGENVFCLKTYSLEFSDYYWSNAVEVKYDIYISKIRKELWTYGFISSHKLDSEYIVDETEMIEYRYKEKYCRLYTINKKYNDTYTRASIGDYINKDESKVKKYYSFQTRDKLEIDVYDITESNFDLNKFVISYTDNYKITNNINWSKNGKYDITFKLNDIIVNKTVNLNLKENTIIEYKNKIEELEKELDYVTKNFQEKENLYNEKIKQLELEIITLTKDLASCKEDCEKDKNCLEQLIKEKDTLIEQYNIELTELSDKVNELQVELKDKLDSLESLTIINDEKNKEINLLKETLEKLAEESKIINENIISDYNKKIDSLNNLNDNYANKIIALEDKIKVLNDKLANVVSSKQQLEKDLNEEINLNKILKEENNNINSTLEEELKNKEALTLKLKSEAKEKEKLNSKLHNYLLKINNFKINNFVWIYILIFLIVIFIVNWLRKRSK